MGKKQRRKQHRKVTPQAHTQPVRPSTTETPEATQGPRVQKTPAPTQRTRTAPSWTEFRERYRYVNSELKHIGVLAGSFLVVLLILSAVLG